MILTNNDAIEQYWDEVNHKYPEVTKQQFIDMCKAPFAFFKQCMRDITMLPVIMVKHIGKFKIFPGAIEKQIKAEKVFVEKGLMDKETQAKRNKIFTDYLTKLKSEPNEVELCDDDTE